MKSLLNFHIITIKQLAKNWVYFSAFVLILGLFGIRFEYPILNYIVIALCFVSLWFVPYLLFTWKIPSITLNIIKMVVGIFISLLALGTVIPLFFISFDIHSLATDWNGVDKNKEEIRRVQMKNSDVVVYLTNGGATTDFGTVIQKEKKLGLGLKKISNIDGIYHTNDIEIEKESDDSILIKKIHFTDFGRYKQEYYENGGTLKDGDLIKIK